MTEDPATVAAADPLPSTTITEPPPAIAPERAQEPTPATPPVGLLHLPALTVAPTAELLDLAVRLGVRTQPLRPRPALINEIARAALARPEGGGGGGRVTTEGVLEIVPELGGGGVLRCPATSFLPAPSDVFVPVGVMKNFGLRPGQRLAGTVRLPAGGQRDKLMVLDRITAIEGTSPEQWRAPKEFDALTPMFPDRRIILESPAFTDVTVRAIDLVATLGRGQRGLIVAPPRGGKTMMLKSIAKAIRAAEPDVHLILLLVDERPEEVTDFRADVDAEIYASTFDEGAPRHLQVAELVSERAKRLVELGQHVVILLDSITRLSRGYNAMLSTAKNSRTMSGGVDSKALAKPKKFFSAARNCEEGGSLTILATALIETGSRADDVIFEEYKGTGNMELHLDRELLERRVFPAIQILKSGTRRDDLLYHPDELTRVHVLRKQLAELPAMEAMEALIDGLNATGTNAELLLLGLKI